MHYFSTGDMITGLSYLYLIGILLSARVTMQASTPTTPYYVGAAVEYHPVVNGDNLTVIANENANNYIKFLEAASKNDVDIIVFPENGLTSGKSFASEERWRYLPHSSYIPDPKDAKIPCHDQSIDVMKAVRNISCAASRYKLYVVINIREKEKCTDEKCSKDGHNLYNTNVVFDRSGAVISKYRKYNLYEETGLNKTNKPELSVFKTDFDVSFGHFICFDLLFETPALHLVRERKVTDILFPTHWFSELPFLTANQVQAAWSYANNVNFLASGYNNPQTGSGGSGIYAGTNGILNRIWSEKRANAIIISKIPKVINGNRGALANDPITVFYSSDEISTTVGNEPVPQQSLKSDDILPFTSQIFVPVNGTTNVTVCDRGLCCHFIADTSFNEVLVKSTNVKYYSYRFAVFNGVRSFSGAATGGLEVCGVISCMNNDISSCTKRFESNAIIVHPTAFNSLKISGNFTTTPKNLYLPISLNFEMQPLNVTDFTFTTRVVNKSHTSIEYNLTKPKKDLMTFAIYGRNFSADGKPQTVTSAAASTASTVIFVLIMTMITGFCSNSINSLENSV